MAASNVSIHGWDTFFGALESLISSCRRQDGVANLGFTDYAIGRLNAAMQTVSSVLQRVREGPHEVLRSYGDHLQELLSSLRMLITHWQMYADSLDQTSTATGYHVRLIHTHRQGRPRFEVDEDQLLYLRSLSFNWTAIAALLGVSRMTV